MPDLTPYINFGLGGILLILIIILGFPLLRGRIERQDKADDERRTKAEAADQARREAADKERREQQALLLQHLQFAADKAERRMEEQETKFLGALERRDQQAAEQNTRTVEALRSLTAAVDSLQRRQQR